MLKIKIRDFWKNCWRCTEDTWIQKKLDLLNTDGTFENFILKSLVGFIGGIFLTYTFFMFFVFQLNFTLSSATLLCSIFGIILTIGLAFSHRVRCVVFLLLPQFFSKRGRQALMAYAFILALTGPAKNTLHNIGVLSESLACGQEQLKEAVRTIIDLVKQPFYALKDAIADVIKTVKLVAKRIKAGLLAIKRMVLSILRAITAVFEWLGSVINICNKKLGTPFERCEKVFDGAVADCYAKLGPLFGGICNLAYIVGALCYIVKPLDFICILVSFVSDAIVGAVRKKIKKFAKHMSAMFYVKVDFSHSFHFETNQSKTLQEVATGIVTEIRSRTDKFLTLFDWMSFVTSFFVLFMLLRVIHYRHKWLTNERFDNQYITQDLRQIDLIRAKQDKETVLPLNPRERNKYIPLTSITLIAVEKIHLTKSAVFLSLTTFKLCIHMMVDYSLYWILSTIRYHGRFETKVQQVNSVGIYVSGEGYLASLYRSIVRAFSPSDANIEIDTLPCLPDPIPPNLDRYTQIVSLILICWIMAVFEPYGLRLRQVVMGYYHPDRARQRAVWLYNHIVRSRGSFIKYARRQLRRKFGINGDKTVENITVKERIMALCPMLHLCFPQDQKMCLLCGTPQRDDNLPHIKCPTPGCVGIFCPQCFADLQNLCTICKSPMEYGDMSDMSEERDSSEDDEIIRGFKRIDEIEPTETEEPITEEPTEIEETTGEKELKKEELSESSSEYSMSYQEGTPPRLVPGEYRICRKDVEAQKLRDDVTIQIFNEPLIGDASDTSGEPASCFVLRARRKLKSRVKPTCPPCEPDLSSSSSSSSSCTCSGDSESTGSSGEIEEEEVLHVEIEEKDGRRALLGRGGRKNVRKNRTRMRRIVDALNRVSFIRNKEQSLKYQRKSSERGSITQRVIKLLQSRDPMSCIPCKRASRKSRSDGEQFDDDSIDTPERKRKTKRSKSHPREIHRHYRGDIYSMNWDSHRERGGTDKSSGISRGPGNNTKYYEINETARGKSHLNSKKQKKSAGKEMELENEAEIYDPLAGLEIYGVESKKPRGKIKRLPIRDDIKPISHEDVGKRKKIMIPEKIDEKRESSDVEEQPGISMTSEISDTSELPEEKDGRRRQNLYSEYAKKFKKKKKKNKKKKCKKCKDQGEQTEQRVMSPEATQTSQQVFRPVIYPVPCCCHREPICPEIGYDVEGWIRTHRSPPHHQFFEEDEEEEEEEVEECQCECTCHYEEESSSVRNIVPKFVACEGIQTDPVLQIIRPKIPKGGEALPYQSTETFPRLIAEYKEITRPSRIPEASDEESPLIPNDKELIQIYPKPGPSGVISRLKNRISSAIMSNSRQALRKRSNTRQWGDVSSSEAELQRDVSTDDETVH